MKELWFPYYEQALNNGLSDDEACDYADEKLIEQIAYQADYRSATDELRY